MKLQPLNCRSILCLLLVGKKAELRKWARYECILQDYYPTHPTPAGFLQGNKATLGLFM